MSAAQLLANLRATGVSLVAARGRLRVRAPKDVLTEELLSRLQVQKPELLRLLESEVGENGDRIDRNPVRTPDRPISVNSVNNVARDPAPPASACFGCHGTRFWRHADHGQGYIAAHQ